MPDEKYWKKSRKKFGVSKKSAIFAIPNEKMVFFRSPYQFRSGKFIEKTVKEKVQARKYHKTKKRSVNSSYVNRINQFRSDLEK